MPAELFRRAVGAFALAACVVLAPGTGTAAPGAVPRTADDVEATLFASEPLLSSPSDIDVDARGRVWVCEVMNYRGKKETRAEGDRILVLEDSDGDGTADRTTVFHQGRDVDSALGICVIGEGPGRKVIVSCAPDVFIFHDDDGDLKADRRESLFTKTGQPQHDHSVHAFVVGPDGRWYFNFGNTGKALHDKEGNPVRDRFGNVVAANGKPYREGMVFRCQPDGTDVEVLGHNFRNNYEVAADSFGNLWQSDNDDDGNRGVRINFVMEHGNYGYTDERTGAGWRALRTNLETEVPLRHWHQNDPGVVPNLLLTGAGSPSGICVYEGSLLPERFRGSLIHCDPGPNVVRAYHVRPAGAGFAAESEALVDGAADQWFRPSDVCVAPDGSLIVADWHDPGVGGHGMGDTEKGRLYRIAPRGSRWSVPAVDTGSMAGAVAALASPNLCTRATALEFLAARPDEAREALSRARQQAADPRLRARLAWAWAMLPGQAEPVSAALAEESDEMRVVALRILRRVKGDVLGLVEKLAPTASAGVRRECAIALRGVPGERADRAWAEVASRHEAGDRWEVEALGIGADSVTGFDGPGQWDGRLAAWLAKMGDRWRTPGAREIVWRSRATTSADMIRQIIADPATTAPEALAFVRALDFQDRERAMAAVMQLAKNLGGAEEKRRTILPELVMRLDPAAVGERELADRIAEAAEFLQGMPRFIELVKRFRLSNRADDLVRMATVEGEADYLAAAAAALALDLGGEPAVRRAVEAGDAASPRLVAVLGASGQRAAIDFLGGLLDDARSTPEVRTQAVRGLASSQGGAKHLVEVAAAGRLTGVLPQVAAAAIAAIPWADVRQAATAVLPMPKAKGTALPPVRDLVQRRGDAARGKAAFAGAGTCAKCHVVGGEGKAVGPDLSGIGAKLSREALYEAILAPSAAISHSYETYTAVGADGRTVTGLLVSKSPEAVVIRGADGLDVSLPGGDVEEFVKQPVSLMPADLAALLSAEELVDLVTWLETLRATK
jgi:putative membrane-bound dehydrogenase-like protein